MLGAQENPRTKAGLTFTLSVTRSQIGMSATLATSALPGACARRQRDPRHSGRT